MKIDKDIIEKFAYEFPINEIKKYIDSHIEEFQAFIKKINTETL